MDFSEQKIKAYLKGQCLIDSTASKIDIEQFTNGYSNLTYLLTVEEKAFVLRRAPKGATKNGHDMHREYKVLDALKGFFEKVPFVYTFCDDISVIGSDFYIMEKVEGVILTFAEARRMEIKPDDFKLISETWLDVFVALHGVDYIKAGLSTLGRPDGYVKRQVLTWGMQYEKSKTQNIPEADQVIKWMEAHQPKAYDHCLIHNDYKYDNVVFERGNWANIVAILDWEMCTLGDPLMDLGTSLAYWTTEDDDGILKQGIPSPTLFSGNPSRFEIINAYALKSGRSINNLLFYYVYGLYKLAVIAQQIYYRYHKGLTQNPKFEHLDKSAHYLMIRAWHVIQSGKI